MRILNSSKNSSYTQYIATIVKGFSISSVQIRYIRQYLVVHYATLCTSHTRTSEQRVNRRNYYATRKANLHGLLAVIVPNQLSKMKEIGKSITRNIHKTIISGRRKFYILPFTLKDHPV